jgi:AcrR family transcriptional regulator
MGLSQPQRDPPSSIPPLLLPDGESPLDRKTQTKIRLLAAMVEVGARCGYAEASVERVIEAAGIARSTFYEHFADRDECFLAALDYLASRLLGEVEAATEDLAAEATVGTVVGEIANFAAAEPAAARLLFFESLAAGRRSLELRGELMAKIAGVIEAAWAKEVGGERRLDLPARMLVGGVFRLLGMRLRHSDAELDGLSRSLIAWGDSYAIASGQPRWRERGEEVAIERLAPESLPSLEVPLPLTGGRHRLSSSAVRRSQRLRILRATAKCSHEKDYSAVRVTDIVTVAQVSRKTFYAQFRAKADAATEANEQTFQAAMSATAAAFFAASEWPERVWEGGRALLSFIAAYPDDSYLGFVEPHAIGAATVRHIYDRLGAFTLFLEEGYNYRPEARALPKACSEALAAVMFELAFQELWGDGGAEGLLRLLPQIAYMTLAPFMGPAGAAEFLAEKVAV